jgi:acyl-CoA synthetase (AMP-forming)/AMP-acid ligase II
MPEWGMTYFGILKAGATAVPIDPASSVEEIINFAKAGEVSAIVVSPKLDAENPELREKIAEAWSAKAKGKLKKAKADSGISAPVVWTFDEVFEMPDEIEEAKRLRCFRRRYSAMRSRR